MRIIGGEASGRRIRAPRGAATRPTSDKVRQALMNILGAPPQRVLDLYAGAGGLGLEALSRGAATCVFVDKAELAARTIEENLRELGWTGRGRVLRADALTAVARLKAQELRFGWIFVDPPYASDEAARALAALGDVLDDGGVVIVEHDRRHLPPDQAGELARADRRRWGDTEASFYRREA